ncbi:MAG UNVERIFIED_CONTAM: hypothetical protein LVT10_20330 [Anaerolineae bacterium]|jgi:hypothetical protein
MKLVESLKTQRKRVASLCDNPVVMFAMISIFSPHLPSCVRPLGQQFQPETILRQKDTLSAMRSNRS